MTFKVVIPARFASSRLPGKPLLDIAGQPMIWHVYQKALASGAQQVVLATDDQRIADAAVAFGAEVCMTSDTHQSGTDRIEEVARQLGWSDETVVVNLQGDEPLMPTQLVSQVADLLDQHADCAMSTLAVPMAAEQVFDSNAVKVVTDDVGRALYFSRAPIPWHRGDFEQQNPNQASDLLRHLGIYAYRVGFLHRYVTWPPASIEQAESLEQLRVLANGERIAVGIADETPPPGVDTASDYERLLSTF